MPHVQLLRDAPSTPSNTAHTSPPPRQASAKLAAAPPAPSAPAPAPPGAVIRPLRLDAQEAARRHERRARFQEELAAGARAAGVGQRETLVQARRAGAAAEGRSTALEREFLRLTALPALEDVRPPGLLAESLALVKARWVQVGPVRG